MSGVPESVCAAQAILGEGPVWIDGALWFVDIKRRQVHRFDPAAPALRTWDAPGQVGWILPAENGAFLAGLQGGIYRFDPASGDFTLWRAVEADRPSNRLNDATTDCAGRIWFGTMDDSEAGVAGRFYRCDRGEIAETGLPPVAITNGPAVSPDGRLLYATDTLGKVIHVCDVAGDGSLANCREFVRFGEGDGHPDGPIVDAEGCVWSAQFGGWQALRFAPDGQLLERVRFPVSNLTKLAFGGPDFATLYATSAQLHLRPDQLARQRLAGNVFAFAADVPGLPVVPARLG
jgi:sugar lactone lactonase YvrE